MPLLVLFGAIIVPNAPEHIGNLLRRDSKPFSVFFVFLVVLYLVLFINLVTRYVRITRKMQPK